MQSLGLAMQASIFRLDPKSFKVIAEVFHNDNDPFIGNMIDIFYGSLSNTSVNIKDTGNTTRSFTSALYLGYNGFGDLGVTTRGIVVGTGSASPTFDDYNLGSLIAHGTGSGQLFYYQCLTEYITSLTNKRIRLFQRPIRNGSNANVTVNEMGLILTNNSVNHFLLARDVISGGLSIAPNDIYLFQYAFEVAP